MASTSIVGPEGSDGKQLGALWEASAPSRGAPATVHGEVIRIVGKTSDETGCDGGMNWDGVHRAMLAAFAARVASGPLLMPEKLDEVAVVVGGVSGGPDMSEQLDRLWELAVRRLAEHPATVRFPEAPYSR
jgi:hypothetical protein